MKRNKLIYAAFMLLFIFSCSINNKHEKRIEQKKSALQRIWKEGKLRVVTDCNSVNYFIYKGQPMGYQYEMLQELANYMGVKIELEVNNNLNENFKKLIEGKYDLIASNLTVTKERRKFIDFTIPHSSTNQVLVQRKTIDNNRLTNQEDEEQLINNPLDLAGKTIYVKKNSSHAVRLRNLSDEIGYDIYIKEVALDVETLIDKVAIGEIKYTISDENVAKVAKFYYPNIDIETRISFEQNLAWGLRKGSEDLNNFINNWLNKFKKNQRFKNIYAKYFKNSRSSEFLTNDYYVLNSGKISEYDEYIKKHSKDIGWDWRLLASLIYQESRFNPKARSWAGAFGLMQLMPRTASNYGVTKYSSPEEHIKAGVQFIKWLNKRFDYIADTTERIQFILASYNAGYGHVVDAQKLAKKNGKNPNIWYNNVDLFILGKSSPVYYKDPVVKYGYCRGSETFNYVSSIVDRYEHYKNLVRL